MAHLSTSAPLRVLLVDDNPDQVLLLREVAVELGCPIAWQTAGGGAEALDLLQRGVAADGAVLPDLVLLDLKMPHRDGWDVLRAVKSDDRLCTIPVVVFTSSRNAADIARAYRSCASGYFTKPADLRGLESFLENLHRYWAGAEHLPR